MTAMRRAVIYFVLAAVCGLIGGVGLGGQLGANEYTVSGLIVGTHTGSMRGANGGRSTVYYVDVERQDTYEEVSVRNAPFYDAYEESHDPNVTLDIRAIDEDVESVAAAHYLGKTYDGTTKAEGIGVAIAFLVLTALFLGLGVRRMVVVRRKPKVDVPPGPVPGDPGPAPAQRTVPFS